MYKKLTALSTTILLGLGSAFAAPSVMAQQSNGIQAGISNADSQMSQFQVELDKLKEQNSRVEEAYNDNNKMMIETESKVKESQVKVQQLQQEVITINERIQKRNEILKKRAQTLQETGGNVNYLDVLLGASSFEDFISRVGAVTTIVQSEQDTIQQQKEDKQEVEKKQVSVENELADLKSRSEELKGMREGILEQKKQNDALKAEIQKKQQDKLAEQQQAKLQAQQQQEQQQQTQNVTPKTATSAFSQSNSQTSSKSSSKSTPSYSATINVSKPSSSGSIHDIVTAGYKYIGNSVYVFGGGRSSYDIAHGRFDCSGFVHWAFAQAGYSIGSSTDALKNSGTRVSLSQARPGDLVFFNTYKTDGHVGIYLGGGRFIGSQSSTGVAIADLTHGYWKDHFNGRVLRIAK